MKLNLITSKIMRLKKLFGIFGSRQPKSANINENKESSQSQCKMILEHLKEGKTLTGMEALNLFGTMKAATRVSELKQKGHNIVTTTITLPNGKRVAQYSLVKE